MDLNIADDGKIAHLKARNFSPVELDLTIMVIGKQDLGMEMEYALSIASISILETGIMIKWKEWVDSNMEKTFTVLVH